MGSVKPPNVTFQRGLEDTPGTRGEDPFRWIEFQNLRAATGNAKRRPGRVRLYRFTATADLMDLDGTNDFVTLSTNTRIFPLGTRFTLETLFIADDLSADSFILGSASASNVGVKIKQTTTNTVVTTVTDSAGNATTITHSTLPVSTKCAWQLVRDGASLVCKINGVSQTGTMSATNLLANSAAQVIGKDNAGGFLNGRVDFLRALRLLKTSQMDGWARLLDPRSPSVIFDYIISGDANATVVDRGPLGMHAVASGSPASNATPLAINPAPVLGIGLNQDNSAAQQGYVRVGTQVYPVKFA